MLKPTALFVALTLSLAPLAEAHFLWRIETEKPSYLYGTVHSSHPSVRDLPTEVTEALKNSSSFHPELELSPENIGRITAAMFAPTENDLETELPPALWERVKNAAQSSGVPLPLLRRIPLQLLPVLFATPTESDFNRVVDVQVHELAKEHGLEIQALETVDEQMNVFRNLEREDAIRFLKDALEERERGFPTQRKVLQLYSDGDLDGLMRYFADEMERLDLPALARDLVELRNHRMVKRLLPAIESGGAFVAVGTAHMPGEEGIVELLRQNGYTVTRVPLQTEAIK